MKKSLSAIAMLLMLLGLGVGTAGVIAQDESDPIEESNTQEESDVLKARQTLRDSLLHNNLQGTYGLILEMRSVPESDEAHAAVSNMLGTIEADGAGNIIAGQRALNFAGNMQTDTVTGTYTLQDNGTVRLILNGIQNDERAAVEEFACHVGAGGAQFECIITRLARVNLGPEPVELPVVGTARGERLTDPAALNRSVIRDYMDAWEKGDVDALRELLAEGFVNHSPPLPADREGLIQVAVGQLAGFPDGRWTIKEMVTEGDMVAAHMLFEGTHEGEFLGEPATGTEVSFTATLFFRVEDGKITDRWGDANELALMTPLGYELTPPTTDPSTSTTTDSPIIITVSEPYGTFNGVDFVRHQGSYVGIADGADFSAPIEIITPADPSQGNGCLVIEPYHFQALHGARDGFLGPDLLFGQGFSYAAICWGDPGAGENHPCATFQQERGMGVKILAGFARTLKEGGAAEITGMIDRLYSIGFSRSADPLHRLLLDPLGQDLFDFSLLLTTGWPLPLPLEGFPSLPEQLLESLAPPEQAGRVITILTEADLILFNASLLRDAGTVPSYRSYEIAGGPHVPGEFVQSGLAWMPVVRALCVAGDRWVTEEVEPPDSIAIEVAQADTTDPVYEFATGISRDENLNALGGIRLPDVVLGQSQFIAVNLDDIPLFGSERLLACEPSADGSMRFPDHETYVEGYTQITMQLVEAGFLRLQDAEVMVQRAAESDMGKPGVCP